ncbi:MAG: ADP-glyceromanno-heptose 6-epimerase [Rhodospirillaceae bacterium]|nr:ADP-glyceromanno-heptose 6-epimerase [Rhodospirillaceae bacterium]|tara:strand:- start:3742 stop:4734 length:993 start_codon:yes stop_codon:yes gene_type:complete
MILVTGGAGFIGSNLVAELESAGANDIVVCDRLGSDEKWRNIAKRDLADIIAPENVLPFIDSNANRLETIFHLGAISATTETDADLIIDNNFRLSCELWTRCTRYGIPFIYASSAATYGDGAVGFDDNGDRDHLASLKPLNAYGWSKHLFDRWVSRTLATESNDQAPPQWAGLKFFNVYGPNEYHKEGQISVALKNYREISAGGPAVLFRSHNPDYEDGGQSRDFVWVGDCVKVMLWLMETPSVSGLFNLGTGKARSFADLANAIFAAAKITPEIKFIDTPIAIRDKYQYFTEARMDRLRQAGYSAPFTDLENGVSQYVRNFLATEDPYI